MIQNAKQQSLEEFGETTENDSKANQNFSTKPLKI